MEPLQPSDDASSRSKGHRGRDSRPYKGVRMRAWGKWVSEIRIPKTGQRIWLGSYDTPEKAARAYDAALYCIHGQHSQFNFPAERRPELPESALPFLSKRDIKAIAFDFATLVAPQASPLPSSEAAPAVPEESSGPHFPVSSSAGNAGNSLGYVPSIATEAAVSSIENLELDDFLMFDVEWIDSL